jgi:hypothetical protein
MTYLLANEIWVGGISSVSELALVLPRRKQEETLLISQEGDASWTTFLDHGRYQYHSFQISGEGGGRKGLIVPGIRIELDQASIFDPNRELKLGSMIRDKDKLSILAQVQGAHGFNDEQKVQIVGGLPICDGEESAGYKKWRVVLGGGDRQRVIWQVDFERGESSD